MKFNLARLKISMAMAMGLWRRRKRAVEDTECPRTHKSRVLASDCVCACLHTYPVQSLGPNKFQKHSHSLA